MSYPVDCHHGRSLRGGAMQLGVREAGFGAASELANSPVTLRPRLTKPQRALIGRAKSEQRLRTAREQVAELNAKVTTLYGIIAALQAAATSARMSDRDSNTGNAITFDLFASEVCDASAQTDISVRHDSVDKYCIIADDGTVQPIDDSNLDAPAAAGDNADIAAGHGCSSGGKTTAFPRADAAATTERAILGHSVRHTAASAILNEPSWATQYIGEGTSATTPGPCSSDQLDFKSQDLAAHCAHASPRAFDANPSDEQSDYSSQNLANYHMPVSSGQTQCGPLPSEHVTRQSDFNSQNLAALCAPASPRAFDAIADVSCKKSSGGVDDVTTSGYEQPDFNSQHLAISYSPSHALPRTFVVGCISDRLADDASPRAFDAIAGNEQPAPLLVADGRCGIVEDFNSQDLARASRHATLQMPLPAGTVGAPTHASPRAFDANSVHVQLDYDSQNLEEHSQSGPCAMLHAVFGHKEAPGSSKPGSQASPQCVYYNEFENSGAIDVDNSAATAYLGNTARHEQPGTEAVASGAPGNTTHYQMLASSGQTQCGPLPSEHVTSQLDFDSQNLAALCAPASPRAFDAIADAHCKSSGEYDDVTTSGYAQPDFNSQHLATYYGPSHALPKAFVVDCFSDQLGDDASPWAFDAIAGNEQPYFNNGGGDRSFPGHTEAPGSSIPGSQASPNNVSFNDFQKPGEVGTFGGKTAETAYVGTAARYEQPSTEAVASGAPVIVTNSHILDRAGQSQCGPLPSEHITRQLDHDSQNHAALCPLAAPRASDTIADAKCSKSLGVIQDSAFSTQCGPGDSELDTSAVVEGTISQTLANPAELFDAIANSGGTQEQILKDFNSQSMPLSTSGCGPAEPVDSPQLKIAEQAARIADLEADLEAQSEEPSQADLHVRYLQQQAEQRAARRSRKRKVKR